MPLDKFGRFIADGIDNPSTSSNINSNLSFKNYIDNCLKKTKEDIEIQLNSLQVYHTQLQDLYKNQTIASISQIEKSLQKVEEFKNKTNLSIFNLEKNYTYHDLIIKSTNPRNFKSIDNR